MKENNKKARYGYRRNPVYRFIRYMVWVFSPKYTVEGVENLPDEPVAIVGNHSKANGPIVSQLYMPREAYTWCVGDMMHVKDVPSYAFEDFWSKKPKWTHPLFHLLSYIIAPLAAFIMTHADTIGVYHDKRVINTFKESVEKMENDADVVIFPECYEEHNNIVHEFQRGFVDLARMSYKKTKKNMAFVPVYICPALRKIIFGKPIYYDNEANPKDEAERSCNGLMDAISEIAYALPEHRVVPYVNARRKYYPTNARGVTGDGSN